MPFLAAFRALSQRTYIWPLVTGLILLALAVSKATLAQDGWMLDTDDFFRLQQIRDLMAGQAWFDVSQSRFETPEGGAMHWSRLPDLPVIALIFALEPFTGLATAERLAVFFWPLILLATAFTTAASILHRVQAGAAGQVAGLVMLASGGAAFQFWPNRIDHHALSLVLGLIALWALLSPTRSRRSAILAGVCVAAMLSIALESLPMAGVLIAGFGLAWIVRGPEESARLLAFGASLMTGALLAFALDAPGATAARYACDAFGVAHLSAAMTGGALFCGLSLFTPRFTDWKPRAIASAIAGAITLGVVLLTGPDCFGSPLANISETARLNWLDGVPEARSLTRAVAENPPYAVYVYGVALAALIAGIFVYRRTPRGRQFDVAMLLIVLIVSLIVSLWQVRGVLFAHPAASLVGGLAIGHLYAYGRAKHIARAILLCAAGFVFLSPQIWLMIGGTVRAHGPQPALVNGLPGSVACLDPKLYTEVSALPPSRVMAPIDLGPALLARTPHTIFAAPYHRNIGGIERATAFWSATPEKAALILKESGADYLLMCPALGELARYARRTPDCFASAMLKDDVPDWLTRASETGEGPARLILYRITWPDELDSAVTNAAGK